jgi:acetyl-CoA C-acetyltransferase
MIDYDTLPDNTPVLVGAGQVVQHEATADSPLTLAVQASRAALASAGSQDLLAAIDTISVTRLFTDSMGIPECPFGRSNNPPMSIATALGASPAHCIYGQVGGTEPQGRVIEFARDIARGERSVVLLAGGEAIRNQRTAQRNGQVLDWSETFDPAEYPLEDRGWGGMFVTGQEVSNGLLAAMYYYALIEQAQASAKGRDRAGHRAAMVSLLAPMSEIAAANPCAQFPAALAADDILEATSLNHLYTKRMVAQDGVNQGAALLLCSVGAARRLGVPTQNWVFLHGLAQGEDVCLTEREDPARSPMAEAVLERALAQAGREIADISLIDLYSCFPCAVSSVAEFLGLPLDGSRPLTLTGGLAYFGGPGNNYVMHSLAEAVTRLRKAPQDYALVTSVGGVLSKHGAGIYSRQPCATDWANVDTTLSQDLVKRLPLDEAPGSGRIISYIVNYRAGEPDHAVVLAETTAGGRFVAMAPPGDAALMAALLAEDPVGKDVAITPAEHGALHFRLGS